MSFLNFIAEPVRKLGTHLCRLTNPRFKPFKVYDKETSERIFLPYDPKRGPGLAELPSPSSGAVLVYRRVFSDTDKPRLTKTVLDIKSYLIVEVLKAVVLSERAELEGHSSIQWPNDDVFRYVRAPFAFNVGLQDVYTDMQ